MKKLLVVLLLLLLPLAWWLYRRRSSAPEVPFAKVKRERLVSTLVTNGRVEPIEWAPVRAERPGLVENVFVERGQHATRGSPLAEFSAREAKTDLAAAEARISQARAELELIERGGRPSELSAIEGDLAAAKLELEAAQKELAALTRLAEKQAATRQEVVEASRRFERAQAQIRSLDNRRGALVSQTDRTVAQAKLQEAEAAAKLARLRIEQATIRAPLSGVVYEKAVRPGAYLNAGDLVMNIGQLDKVRVRVYVDEPELGRVAAGKPVTITWDAMAGRRWTGSVERMPTEIVALGTRQVGEIFCVIENPQGELLPGTNISAEILSQAADNALTIPKEALRRSAGEAGVYVLEGNKVAWRKISLGASSVTRAQVLNGLREGDSVALPTERPLAGGLAVQATYPQ